MRVIKPLTPMEIAAAKPRDKAYKLFDGGGLYLEVLPTGGKSWRLKYPYDGKEERITIGRYPEVALKDARAERERIRELVAAGINPREQRKRFEAEKAEAERAKERTFANIVYEWLEKQSMSLTPAYLARIKSQLERYAIPAFGGKNIAEVEREDILAVARIIEKSGAIESAHRFIQRVGQVLRYGINASYCRYDVTSGLQAAIAKPPVKHMSFTTDKKRIGQLLRAIAAYGGYPQMRAALALAPLLMVRPGELARAEWSEIDWEAREWHIPAEKMKKRRKHIVPLCGRAISILQELRLITGKGQYVFPSPKNGKQPLTVESLTVAIRAMGFTPDELHVHGLRHMASTILNERGYNRDWIERQLAHISGDKIRNTYNYAEYLPERHKMMQEWADYLEQLRDGAAA